jgi:hypothetical protein
MSYLCKFLAKLDNLQQASATKRAPFKAGSSLYKPTMLLAVVDSIRNARSGYTENMISIDTTCRDFANLYVELVDGSRPATKIAVEPATQAFWYLGSGKPRIWSLTPQPNRGSDLTSAIRDGVQIKSPIKLTSMVQSARFSAPTWDLLQSRNHCNAIFSFLVARYFPADLSESTVRQSLQQLVSTN